MQRTKIDIEEIEALQKRRKEINSIELGSIDFYKDGKKVEATAEDIEEWRFVGLSNIDFVEMVLDRE